MRLPSAMSFTEIAAREGITTSGAFQIYRRALVKIQRRHRRGEIIHLVLLHRARSQGRPERLAAG
jgi:hypothetical protein